MTIFNFATFDCESYTVKTTHHLPAAFYPAAQEVGVFFYEAGQSSANNRVAFAQNLICFMQAGQKEVSGAHVQERFGSEHLYLLGAGNVLMTEKVPRNGTYRSILLFFSNAYLAGFVRRNAIQLPAAPRAKRLMKIRKDSFLLAFEKALELHRNDLDFSEQLSTARLDELLRYLLLHQPGMDALLGTLLTGSPHATLAAVVQANPCNNLTVGELSFLCHMSIATFKRRFAEAYGTTPKQYFIRQRMQQAGALLKQGKRPSTIFNELGYSDLPAFSREFRKHFGVSPRQFASRK